MTPRSVNSEKADRTAVETAGVPFSFVKRKLVTELFGDLDHRHLPIDESLDIDLAGPPVSNLVHVDQSKPACHTLCLRDSHSSAGDIWQRCHVSCAVG
jgi:hypothetical protein